MAHFKKLDTRPALYLAETVVGAIYAAYEHGDIPKGWVGRNAQGQWIAWNVWGDHWHSYGKTRDAAFEGMRWACWGSFVRATGSPH